MKVLFFVDTHGNSTKLRRLVEKSKNVDLLVCAGDFTIFEGETDAVLHELNSIGKPVLIIHGNHETASSVEHACETLKNLHFIHKNYYIAGDNSNLVFFGYGGGGFSTRDEGFKRSSELFIQEFEKISKQNGKELKDYKIVLVTHAPPFATKLDDLGSHVGNQSITDFIIKHQPVLAVSGHIHETAGAIDKINATKLINPGPDGMIEDLRD
jgi:Icc-related predicted phosphoesterase